MVLGCNFLSWNRYIRKSATDFTGGGGGAMSTWGEIHHFVKRPTCLIDWSDWSPLRSLNSCCHCLRRAVLLDCWGSRSHAWRLRFVRFLWGISLNGWLGRLGRLSGIWLDMATRSQNQGMLGHPRAIRMILLHGESCNSSTTLPNMVDGGKVYASRSYHGWLSASTAVARGSGTGDTNRGKFFENCQEYNAQIPRGSKISTKSLYLARLRRYKQICVLPFLAKIQKNSKWPPFLRRGNFFLKIAKSTFLRYPGGRKFRRNRSISHG